MNLIKYGTKYQSCYYVRTQSVLDFMFVIVHGLIKPKDITHELELNIKQ